MRAVFTFVDFTELPKLNQNMKLFLLKQERAYRFYQTEKIISDAMAKGQHIYHIIASNNLPISKSTVYRHINKQYYSIGRIDLPRAVKFKPRKSNSDTYVPKAVKKNRSYEDFIAFREENPNISIVEMDTVIGRTGGKVILTIHFTAFNFMIGILSDNKSLGEVTSKIKRLKQTLVDNGFSLGKLIPVLFTDNGGEFSNVSGFELNLEAEKETGVFYCHPYYSCEKGKIEKNHTLFRDIVPKGKYFDKFSQETVNLIFSHVNAIKREIFKGKSPYDLFTFPIHRSLLLFLEFLVFLRKRLSNLLNF